MNMYKFGNYICKLREEKSLTQAQLAKRLDVSDKSISKWENGQAFPRIETFEKLADVLDTTVEDILSASKDGVNRICIENDFCSVMQIDINGKIYSVQESKWIEFEGDTVIAKITGEIVTQNDFEEAKKLNDAPNLKEKIAFKVFKKATQAVLDLVLQADCIYKISNIAPDSLIKVSFDAFDLGDKTLMMQNFQVCYPKIECADEVQVELLEANGKNRKQIIKKYKKLGLASDLGMGFFVMFLFYPLRGLYFRHLCSPRTLRKNILNAESHKEKSEKRSKGKKVGCLGGCLSFVGFFLICFFLEIFVFPFFFVESEKPYLVAADYSTITYKDNVYVRIDELPKTAYETTFLGATVWEDSRTDGLSKIDQSVQGDKVKLYEDSEGREYLWLVENYVDTILSEGENGGDKDYEDFDEHYVYVCENPKY